MLTFSLDDLLFGVFGAKVKLLYTKVVRFSYYQNIGKREEKRGIRREDKIGKKK
jgi:hypothetical protein